MEQHMEAGLVKASSTSCAPGAQQGSVTLLFVCCC